MSSSYPFSLTNNYSLLHFVRGFIHLTVFVGLIVYQFLFPLFVNPHLSISLYGLCFIVLMFDSLHLFFYKDNRIFNNYLNFGLIFLDACFFAILFAISGTVGLSFILSLVFLEIIALSLTYSRFSAVLFSFLISLLFSISFIWQGNFPYEDRKVLMTVVIFSCLTGLIFGYFLKYIWEKFKKKMSQAEKSVSHYKNQLDQTPLSRHLENSLHLSRKIQPAISSLLKGFLEVKNKESFPKYYENHLKQLKKFVGRYIKYLELEEYVFKSVHLPKLLENLLQKLGTHKDRPSSLKEKLEYKSSTEWIDCSFEQLEMAFENIIENSFQALKNETVPNLEIRVYDKSDKVVLEFIDNGHGIEKSDQQNLFDPLFSKRLGIGGVGLAYVLKTIEAHKGEIDIVSSSQGTRVLIKLPIFPTHKSKMPLIA